MGEAGDQPRRCVWVVWARQDGAEERRERTDCVSCQRISIALQRILGGDELGA